MGQLRNGGPTGQVLVASADGRTFATEAGAFFAERVDGVFRMADDSVGTLVGSVVFMQNGEGVQIPAYWLGPAPATPE
jgi:hypothetical protein